MPLFFPPRTLLVLVAFFWANISQAMLVSTPHLNEFIALGSTTSVESFESGTTLSNQTVLSLADLSISSILPRLSILDRTESDRAPQTGSHYLKIGSRVRDVQFSFDQPMNAFGLWVNGWGQHGRSGTMSLSHNGGESTFMAESSHIGGDAFFFGFTTDIAFNTITLSQTRGNDAWALDDVYYGVARPQSPAQSVNEPDLATLSLGIIFVMCLPFFARARYSRANT